MFVACIYYKSNVNIRAVYLSPINHNRTRHCAEMVLSLRTDEMETAHTGMSV